jgi:hypothetical protein
MCRTCDCDSDVGTFLVWGKLCAVAQMRLDATKHPRVFVKAEVVVRLGGKTTGAMIYTRSEMPVEISMSTMSMELAIFGPTSKVFVFAPEGASVRMNSATYASLVLAPGCDVRIGNMPAIYAVSCNTSSADGVSPVVDAPHTRGTRRMLMSALLAIGRSHPSSYDTECYILQSVDVLAVHAARHRK